MRTSLSPNTRPTTRNTKRSNSDSDEPKSDKASSKKRKESKKDSAIRHQTKSATLWSSIHKGTGHPKDASRARLMGKAVQFLEERASTSASGPQGAQSSLNRSQRRALKKRQMNPTHSRLLLDHRVNYYQHLHLVIVKSRKVSWGCNIYFDNYR